MSWNILIRCCAVAAWLARPDAVRGDGPGADGRTEVVYPLDDRAVCLPYVMSGAPIADLPGLEPRRLLFRETPVLWRQWVEAWQRDQSGDGAPEVIAEARRTVMVSAFGIAARNLGVVGSETSNAVQPAKASAV